MAASGYLLIGFIVILLMGVPIAFAFGLSSLGYLQFFTDVPLSIIPAKIFGSIDSFPLMAVPFFILAGDLMKDGGISNRLVSLAEILVGRIKGSLGHVTILASMFFGAISGSSAATVAAIGGIMIPEMVDRGYGRDYATALTAAAGFLGVLIPPSVPLVIYGINAGVSVGKLFLAGIGPGVLMGLAFMMVNYFSQIKMGEQIPDSLEQTGSRFKETLVALKNAVPAILMPLIILGGIYGGYFTPTEAAAVAVVYGFVVGWFIFKTIKTANLLKITMNSALTSATILIIISFAGIFGWIITTEQVPVLIAETVTSISSNPVVVLVLINIFLLLIGMVMETITAIVIMTPILLPLATSVGVDPIHFGVIMIVNLSVGVITPPMALNLFLACRIGDTTVSKIVKPLLPFLAISVIILIIITYVPSISLYLPSLLN